MYLYIYISRTIGVQAYPYHPGVMSMLVIGLYMSLLMDLATLSAKLSTYVLASWPRLADLVVVDLF